MELTMTRHNHNEKQRWHEQRWQLADPTVSNLKAALLDQKIAGAFQDVQYAYVPCTLADGFGVGIAVANENGYSPVTGFWFSSYNTAATFCDGMNKHIGLPMDHANSIVCSSMGGSSHRPFA
jgi:hypothetical protein